MQTCATCRHWQEPSESNYRADFGECGGIPFTENLSDADHLAEMRQRLDADPAGPNAQWLVSRLRDLRPIEDEIAFTEDGSGYYAGLRTRPTFGCVCHQPRD